MATITLPAKEVQAACVDATERIMQIRHNENEDMIKEAMKPKSFLGFKFLAKTRAQAVDALQKDMWSFYPSLTCQIHLEKVQKLLTLAQKGDPVTLNEEDCWVIF